jgi:AraC-like DNA-binding protein
MRRLRIGDDARNQMRQALVDGLANDEPLSLKAIAQELGCSCASLYKYFPDLVSSVVTRYRERFNRERIRQRLQEVLSSPERTPSIRGLARQLGCNHHFLERNFHDLCKKISLRYRTERRKQHEDRLARTYAEIRVAIMELHQQGIYPRQRRVVKQMNKPHALRSKEGREVYSLVLKELSYPNETFKKVGFGKN